MVRRVQHNLLTKAKTNKKDEFYTQLCDIESELSHYEKHFHGKIVLCNCDDARNSNFYKYFVNNFEKLGLSKVMCVCYTKDHGFGYCYEYDGTGEKYPSTDNLTVLNDNGDFRSYERIFHTGPIEEKSP